MKHFLQILYLFSATAAIYTYMTDSSMVMKAVSIVIAAFSILMASAIGLGILIENNYVKFQAISSPALKGEKE